MGGDGKPPDEVLVAAALFQHLGRGTALTGLEGKAKTPTPWQTVGSWEIGEGA
jgi:hypothetical protein